MTARISDGASPRDHVDRQVPAGSEAALGVRLLVRVLRAWRWIFLAGVLAELLVVGALLLAPRTFSATAQLATINSNRKIGDRAYWDGIAAVEPTSPAAAPRDSYLTTVGGFVRKGLWIPLPAFEFGAGALSILGSRMYVLQGYAKMALQVAFSSLIVLVGLVFRLAKRGIRT